MNGPLITMPRSGKANLILIALIFALAGNAFATNRVLITTLPDPVVSIPYGSTCDITSGFSLGIDEGTLLNAGTSGLYFDLPAGVALCQDVDFVISPTNDCNPGLSSGTGWNTSTISVSETQPVTISMAFVSLSGGIWFHVHGNAGTSRVNIDFLGIPGAFLEITTDPGNILGMQILDGRTNASFTSGGIWVDGDSDGTYESAATADQNRLWVDVSSYDGASVSAFFDSLADQFTIIPSNPVVATISPVANNDGYTTNEDAQLTIAVPGVMGNDNDPAGTMSVSLVSTVTSLVLDPDGSFVYTPATDFFGTETFSYEGFDGTNSSNIADISITVDPRNDPPSYTPGGDVTVDEDSEPYFSTWATNISTGATNETDTLTFTLTNSNTALFSEGPDINALGVLSFIPAAEASGVADLDVYLSDGMDSTSTQTFRITVNSVNDPPVINGQSPLSTPENTFLEIFVEYLDIYDPDSTSFTLAIQSGENYAVDGSGILPDVGFTGFLTVPVTVTDGQGAGSFDLAVAVTDSNDLPVITGQTYLETPEATPIEIRLTNLTVVDPDDPWYPEGFTLYVSDGANYTIEGNVVTPVAGFSGSLSVPVQVNDGTNMSNVFYASVTVVGESVAPVFHPLESQVATANRLFSYTVRADDSDSSALRITASGLPEWLALTDYGNGEALLSGTPGPNDLGSYSVSLTVTDPDSLYDTQVFTFQIIATNVTPVITGQTHIETSEGTALEIELNHLTVDDPDNDYPEDFELRLRDPGMPVGDDTYDTVCVAVGDVNGDGMPDIVAGNENQPNTVYFNNGMENPFQGVFGSSVSPNMNTTASLALGDIDNDGDLDLIEGNNGQTDRFYLNTGAGTFGQGTELISMGGGTTSVVLMDMNYDGRLDLAAFAGATFRRYINNGTAEPFRDVAPLVFDGMVDRSPNFASGDFNGDSETDMALAVIGRPNRVYLNSDNFPNPFFTVSNENRILPFSDFSGNVTVPTAVFDGVAVSSEYPLEITVSSTDDPPVIVGQRMLRIPEINTGKRQTVGSVTVAVTDFAVFDPDSAFPDDFSLAILDGDNYTHANNTVTPDPGFGGILTVPVEIRDQNSAGNTYPLLVAVGPDADGDGMPDDWEMEYGLDILRNDALFDLDLDGYRNIDEYHCNSIPNDPASTPTDISGSDNLPPDRPVALSPINHEIFPAGGPVQLVASDISDPEGDRLMNACWLVYKYRAECDNPPVNACPLSNMAEYTVTDLEPGMKYAWRVAYADCGSGSMSPFSADGHFTVGAEGTDRMQVEPGSAVADFTMVSVSVWPESPSAIDVFGAAIGEYDSTNILIGAYDANIGGYVEYGEGLDIEPGRAYWVFSRRPLDIPVNGVPVTTQSDIEVPLAYNAETGKGWNMIAGPNANYTWGDLIVKRYGDGCLTDVEDTVSRLPDPNPYIDKKLWYWRDGDYATDSALIEKGKGYWVKAKMENVSLVFPVDAQLSEFQKTELSFAVKRSADDTGESPPRPPVLGDEADGRGSDGGECFISVTDWGVGNH